MALVWESLISIFPDLVDDCANGNSLYAYQPKTKVLKCDVITGNDGNGIKLWNTGCCKQFNLWNLGLHPEKIFFYPGDIWHMTPVIQLTGIHCSAMTTISGKYRESTQKLLKKHLERAGKVHDKYLRRTNKLPWKYRASIWKVPGKWKDSTEN